MIVDRFTDKVYRVEFNDSESEAIDCVATEETITKEGVVAEIVIAGLRHKVFQRE